MPQLDGLRAFAVTGVAISHWAPSFLSGVIPWGTGVQLFFVLSGFLITGILLRCRPEETQVTLPDALKTFYFRRILRIFPLFYGVLLFCLAAGVGPIRVTWPWHAAYLSNFYYAYRGHGSALTDPFLHFWTLAVEEQFYLLWPFVVLTVHRRVLPVLLGVAILFSALFRVFADRIDPSIVSVRYLTPSCLNALGIGALLAVTGHYAGKHALARLGWACAVVGILGLVVCMGILPGFVSAEMPRRLGHTFLVAFYGALVAGAAMGFPGIIGRILGWRPLVYLGMISYGLYVYHYFAPIAIESVARACYPALLGNTPLRLAAYTLFTLGISIVSWHGFEKPINRLKDRFPYGREARKGERGAAK